MENLTGSDESKKEFAFKYSITNETKRYLFAFSSLFFLLYIIYENSLQGVWLFDDYGDILDNKILSSFTWPDFLRADIINHFSRPIAVLSFLLNYRLGGYDIYGYHVVNFAIHFIAAIFVFLFVYKTLKLPSLASRYGGQAYSIALLAAAFWCTSPLHVTAVTYIAQRYTSMAGMFYFMAMFFFIQGRTADKRFSAILQFTFCTISAVMAFLSKENAAMLPVSLYLYDLLLIRGASKENVRKDLKRAIWPLAGLLLVGSLYLSTTGFPLDYRAYTFTLKERLLTEPRIILFYLSLLIYPMPLRLMLDHDYVLSTSLFTPWTTGVAICVIFGLIGWAFVMTRQRPLIAFCILFFFLNHAIESSFIPIEIVYEYRNYIPSLSFFMLVALFMVWALQFFFVNKRVYFMVAFCITFLLITQGDTVYRRNTLFFSEKTFWMDNVKKAPDLSRPRASLAITYFKEGNNKDALNEARKAVAINKYPNYFAPAVSATNLGFFQNIGAGDQETALKNLHHALVLHPNYPNAHAAMAVLMIKRGDLRVATVHMLKALSLRPDVSAYHSKYSLILFHQGKMIEALKEAHRAWSIDFDNIEAKMIIAEIMRQRKLYERAILFWNGYLQNVPNDRRAILALVELCDRTGQYNEAKVKLNYLFMLEKGDLRNLLSEKNTYEHVYAIDGNVLKPIIKKLLTEMSRECG